MTCNCNGNCQCKTADITNMIIGPGNDDYGRSGNWSVSEYIYDPYHPKAVVDVQVKEETIEITYIRRAMYSITTYNNYSIGYSQEVANPDLVFKEIYGVKDGKLTLLNTLQGRIIPPKLEETYEFPE